MNTELYVLRNKPHRYRHIARRVNLAMKHSYKPCVGEPCDEGFACSRHARTIRVVERYIRMKDKNVIA